MPGIGLPGVGCRVSSIEYPKNISSNSPDLPPLQLSRPPPSNIHLYPHKHRHRHRHLPIYPHQHRHRHLPITLYKDQHRHLYTDPTPTSTYISTQRPTSTSTYNPIQRPTSTSSITLYEEPVSPFPPTPYTKKREYYPLFLFLPAIAPSLFLVDPVGIDPVGLLHFQIIDFDTLNHFHIFMVIG